MLGFIVNPSAGNGKGAKVWTEVEKALIKRGVKYCVRVTSMRGEAQRLTEEILQHERERVTTVVAVGGDGTVNEVINGLYLANKRCFFGHVPAGTGNDFARGNQVPNEPLHALEQIIAHARTISLDLLRFENRVAINNIGAGLDGQIAYHTNHSRIKKLFNRLYMGKLVYAITTLRVLFGYKPCQFTLIIDGKEVICADTWFVTITNNRFFGGSMNISPYSVPDDGLAEVVVISGSNKWKLLPLLALVYTGKHVGHPAVQFYRGNTFVIHPQHKLFVHTDGESSGYTPLHIEVIPGWLQMIASVAPFSRE